MANQWFKFYGGEYLSDPKMDAFDGNERSCWITILSLASQSDDGWILYTTEEKLLEKSGISIPERVIYSGILAKYLKFGMLEYCNGDVTEGFRPKNWEKRQYSEGYSRVKKFREIRGNDSVTAKITTEENRIEENRIEESITNETQKFFELSKNQSNPEFILFLEKFCETTQIARPLAEREIKKFISYWTEPNPTGKKQRWQMQKTFEVKRRLSTWFQNVGQWSKQDSKKINFIF